jgi:hypothetical protein
MSFGEGQAETHQNDRVPDGRPYAITIFFKLLRT